MIWAWTRAFRSIVSSPCLSSSTLKFADSEDMRPTQHGIQWRAKFVAQRREKLVLHAARPLGLRARFALAIQQAQSLAIGLLGLLDAFLRAASAFFRSVMSRATLDAPTTWPAESLIGDTVMETLSCRPSLARRMVSK